MTFDDPDPERFPALELGYRCVDEGSDSGSVLNAADEVAVEAFLERRLSLHDIARVNGSVLDRRPDLADSVAELLRADGIARDLARQEIAALASAT